jgi:hypothetical protein
MDSVLTQTPQNCTENLRCQRLSSPSISASLPPCGPLAECCAPRRGIAPVLIIFESSAIEPSQRFANHERRAKAGCRPKHSLTTSISPRRSHLLAGSCCRDFISAPFRRAPGGTLRVRPTDDSSIIRTRPNSALTEPSRLRFSFAARRSYPSESGTRLYLDQPLVWWAI